MGEIGNLIKYEWRVLFGLVKLAASNNRVDNCCTHITCAGTNNQRATTMSSFCSWCVSSVPFALNSNQINKKLNWLTFFPFFVWYSFLSSFFFVFIILERHLKLNHLVHDWRGLPIKYQLTHHMHSTYSRET